MEERLIYTVQEVASILHSSPNYIYELIRKGYLPAIKLGSLKVLKTTLERFLIQNEGKDLSDLNNIRKVVIQVEVENE
ncbi:MAG: helix-turn-helix domain-containing protein [Bacilli bacterium]|jgi:excisionase family DNA binding protein|nr:helix-turn-helix domain-containing protein [Bacilli bacterium]MBR1385711.1 helix-turn-helix domain-containing protein [Bacilli bacterium]